MRRHTMLGEELVIIIIFSAGYVIFATWLYIKTTRGQKETDQ